MAINDVVTCLCFYLMWFNGSYMGLWDIGLGIYVWDLSRCNLHGWLEGRFGPIWYPHLKKKEKKRRRRRVWDYCNSVPLYALRGIEYFICIVREVSSKEILCFIYDRVVSPCWVFFYLLRVGHWVRWEGHCGIQSGVGGWGGGLVQRVTGCS